MSVNSSAPQIGFDRFIQLDWATAALRVRAGMSSLDDLNTLLDSAGLGVAAKKKTRTVLNRLWLEPRDELLKFANRGAELFGAADADAVLPLCWGMAISTYPFFGKVAELIGRLSSLQGDCASAEVHRRMSEVYGEREGTKRMTNMVMQTQASWGTLQRTDNGKRLIKLPTTPLRHEMVVAWIIEAAARYTGKAISLTALQSLPVLYPFALDCLPAFVVLNSTHLELRSEGATSQFVAIRQ